MGVHPRDAEIRDIDGARLLVGLVSFSFHFYLHDAAKAAAALRREHNAVPDFAFVFESNLVDVSCKQSQGKHGLLPCALLP